MWKDFRAFVLRGNVMDLAVGVVIGAAFGNIVKSLVDDLIMPPIGLLTGGADFNNHYLLLKAGEKAPPPYATPAAAKEAGAVTWNYGAFFGTLLTFLIVAVAIFILVRAINKLYAKPAPETASTKACPECAMSIPLTATRCPHCTQKLAA
jgi:large conductance mechanosensitive channel